MNGPDRPLDLSLHSWTILERGQEWDRAAKALYTTREDRIAEARTRQEELGDRSAWPWLPGSILSQCAPDEWHVCVEARELAVLDDRSPAPAGTADEDLFFPCCFRDASEIRRVNGGEER